MNKRIYNAVTKYRYNPWLKIVVLFIVVAIFINIAIAFINIIFFKNYYIAPYYFSPDDAVSHSYCNDCKKVIKTVWLGEEPITFYEDKSDLVWEARFDKKTIGNVTKWYMNYKALLYDPNGVQVGGAGKDMSDKKNPHALYAGVLDTDKQVKVDGETPDIIIINLLGKDKILWYSIKDKEEPRPIISY